MSGQLHKGISRRGVLGGAAGGGLALLTGRMFAGATVDPDEGTPSSSTVSPEKGPPPAASPTGESITLYNGQHRMADAMSQAFTRATGIAVEQRSPVGCGTTCWAFVRT